MFTPPSGDTVPLFLICKSAEKFDLRDRKVAGSSAGRRRLLRGCGVNWSGGNRTFLSPLLSSAVFLKWTQGL